MIKADYWPEHGPHYQWAVVSLFKLNTFLRSILLGNSYNLNRISKIHIWKIAITKPEVQISQKLEEDSDRV